MVLVLFVIAALVLVTIGAVAVVMRKQRPEERHPFPLVFPIGPASEIAPVGAVSAALDDTAAPAPVEARFAPPAELEPRAARDFAEPGTGSRDAEAASHTRPSRHRKRPRRPAGGHADDVELPIVPEEEPDVTATVRFRRPGEHAVQLLPGRLEVVAGEQRHKEIRLVRVPGENAEVVIGREANGAPGDVALQSATVSRRHARLAYADGVWKVANLSRTNPVVVNDEALSPDRERTLADGDRLELGEVVLRFHAR